MIALFQWLREQRRGIALLIVALCGLGGLAAWQLPAAILPEVTFPRVKVIAGGGERPGDDMMRAVTRPIEEVLRRVPGVLEIRSTTSRGSTEINLDCTWASNMDLTLQRVQGQIEAVRTRLPAGTQVDVRLMNTALFPVLGYSLTSDRRSLAQLRDLALTRLQPELSRLPGVSEVVVQGGRRLEARVTLDPALLQARGLDSAAVADALRGVSELQSVGRIDANRELYLGLVDARPVDLATLGPLPIPVTGAAPVPLATLGRISLEESPEFVRYQAHDREAVLINVLRQPSASTITLAVAVRNWLRSHRDEIPADVLVETFYDQSNLIRASVGSVRDSLVVGALLAILVVALFLGSLRLGLASAIVLPGSVALTLFGLTLAHQSLNLMTLGGFAAAVGLVLDDAIVVVEHLAHDAARTRDVLGRAMAMAEIFPSLVGSSICTIVIFIPFMFLDGVTGAFFKVLALSMTLMLSASLLLCVAVLPLVSPQANPRVIGMPGRFARSVRFASARPWVGAMMVAVLVGSAALMFRALGTGFLPPIDEGSLIVDFFTPPGTSVAETDRMMREVEQQIDATPEIDAWSRRTGDQLGFFLTEPNHGDYVLRLRTHRRRSADEIADDLRKRIEASQPGVTIEFGQLVEDLIGDLTTTPQPIEVRVYGEDRKLTEARARAIAAILGHIKGVVDVKSGVVVSGPDLVVLPAASAARLGVPSVALTHAIEPAVSGFDAGTIVRGTHAWPMRVTALRAAGPAGVRSLAELPVAVAPGRTVRLGDLATLRVDPGETELSRDDLRTVVSVTARLSGRDLGSTMVEIQRRLRRDLPLLVGMSLGYGGLWAEQQSSFRGLAGVLLGATLAVTLTLLFGFRSWRLTGAVLLTVAGSLAGVFAALLVGGATFNVSSFVGAIMMVGIVAENAYFLVAAYRAGRAEGISSADAAEHAALRRARPVLMTTAAGVAALAPLALGFGAGSALLRPLALAVVGGFVTSAPLLLIALPSLLAFAGRRE